MDSSAAHTFFQEVVPLMAVLLAGAWLLFRWTRPAGDRRNGCAGCEHTAAPRPVRHRLTVLRPGAQPLR